MDQTNAHDLDWLFDQEGAPRPPPNQEITTFVPTPKDLCLLARYYTRQGIKEDHEDWIHGSNRYRTRHFSWDRCANISRVVGRKIVNQIARESLIEVREELTNDKFRESLFTQGISVEDVSACIQDLFDRFGDWQNP